MQCINWSLTTDSALNEAVVERYAGPMLTLSIVDAHRVTELHSLWASVDKSKWRLHITLVTSLLIYSTTINSIPQFDSFPFPPCLSCPSIISTVNIGHISNGPNLVGTQTDLLVSRCVGFLSRPRRGEKFTEHNLCRYISICLRLVPPRGPTV